MAKRAFLFFVLVLVFVDVEKRTITQQIKILFQSLFLLLRSLMEWVSRSVWTFCATVGELGLLGFELCLATGLVLCFPNGLEAQSTTPYDFIPVHLVGGER